jgi:predicted Rossmann fold nucleotide-binding protein DprA/Smf involved in DNA uptake
VADFLDAKVREIEERLHELQPLVEEYRRLEAAAAAMSGVDATVRTATRAANGSGSGSGTGTGVRRGRPRGSRGNNTRASQAIALVRARPGITIPDLAEHMGIKPNYLYRILPQLEEDGKVRRKEKGWHPA